MILCEGISTCQWAGGRMVTLAACWPALAGWGNTPPPSSHYRTSSSKGYSMLKNISTSLITVLRSRIYFCSAPAPPLSLILAPAQAPAIYCHLKLARGTRFSLCNSVPGHEAEIVQIHKFIFDHFAEMLNIKLALVYSINVWSPSHSLCFISQWNRKRFLNCLIVFQAPETIVSS